jgi:hypothetical protein
MPVIKPDLMGDVWPGVEPGGADADYGSAVLEPTGPCPIRSFQTFKLTYTVGRFGLDDTGAIRVAFRFVQDGGALQASDPAAVNYVSAAASNGTTLNLLVEPYTYRPWLIALRITVNGGFMREGDTISIVFGDTSGGSPGWRMQTISESAFEFKVSVDACATGQFRPLSDELHVPIVAGPARDWKVVAPTLRRCGEPFSIGIKAEDSWGNPAIPEACRLRLVADGDISGIDDDVCFDGDRKSVQLDGLSALQAGEYTLRVITGEGRELACSNPIVIHDGEVAGYWGDLHGQSGETVGIGTIDEYLEFARDLAFLDVSGHQANDFQITNGFWHRINEVTAQMDETGRFVVFPGYEWSGNTPVGGDHNVFFRHEGCTIRRSSHAMLAERSDLADDANTLSELFAALADEDCVLYAHVGGRPADVAYAHDPRLKTAVEVHSNWGTFEWILTDSLALGHRVGVVANSDGHKGRPGAGPPGATEFGAYGGLTCFLARELSRDAIFECMRRRHHYGTSGSRMHVDVRARFSQAADLFERDPRYFDVPAVPVHEVIMGDIVRYRGETVELSVSTVAGSAVERVDVFNGDQLIHTHRVYEESDLGNRLRVIWQGAEYRGRGRNTFWHGTINVHGADILDIQPFNHWNREREIALNGSHEVSFEAVTSGNLAGVDLTFDSAAGVQVNITTNLVEGQVDLGALGLEDVVLDAGGLERAIRLRRLPSSDPAHRTDFCVPVGLIAARDNAIWVRVTTHDGHQAWSSPIYIERLEG